jgi:hypothetical protein
MVFRRVLAGFLISVFAVVALPTFLFFGVSNSFLRESFYQGPVVTDSYNFLVNVTAKSLFKADDVLNEYFTEDDLKAEITAVFPLELFRRMTLELGNQVEKLKTDPERPLTISMKVFRESLLTFAHNLSFKLFKSLPVCIEGQVPLEDVKGLPSCVPSGVSFNEVAAPFAQKFEASVYSAVPEQIQIDLNAAQGKSNFTFALVLRAFANAKWFLYGALMFLLISIALLVYTPFSLIAKYEGLAFSISGLFGYIMTLSLALIPDYLFANSGKFGEMDSNVFAGQLMSYVIVESQKIALTFLALGAMLILIRIFLVQKYNNEKVF